jgi:hypothetical protein
MQRLSPERLQDHHFQRAGKKVTRFLSFHVPPFVYKSLVCESLAENVLVKA